MYCEGKREESCQMEAEGEVQVNGKVRHLEGASVSKYSQHTTAPQGGTWKIVPLGSLYFNVWCFQHLPWPHPPGSQWILAIIEQSIPSRLLNCRSNQIRWFWAIRWIRTIWRSQQKIFSAHKCLSFSVRSVTNEHNTTVKWTCGRGQQQEATLKTLRTCWD